MIVHNNYQYYNVGEAILSAENGGKSLGGLGELTVLAGKGLLPPPQEPHPTLGIQPFGRSPNEKS